jgi:restriction system protein
MATKADLPSFDSYFVPTVSALKARGGSATIDELEEDVADSMKLSDDVLSVAHGDGPRTQFSYELAWVRTYLKKDEVADNSERGVWSLTARGLTASDSEIASIPQRVRAANYAKRRQREDDEIRDSIDAPTSLSGAEEEETELSWKERLLDALLEMKPDAFERLCQRVLRESGFTKVEVTGRTGDGGIDGIGILRVQLVSFQVLFQSKRWKGSVGPAVVRDFRGAMVGRADKGLIITTGTFTADARREATRDGAPAIDLVDGDTLADLLKQLSLGVRTRMVEEIEIEPIFFTTI